MVKKNKNIKKSIKFLKSKIKDINCVAVEKNDVGDIIDKCTNKDNIKKNDKANDKTNYLNVFIKKILNLCYRIISTSNIIFSFVKKSIIKIMLNPFVTLFGKTALKLLLIKLSTNTIYDFSVICVSDLIFSDIKVLAFSSIGLFNFYKSRNLKVVAMVVLSFLEKINFF